MSTRRFCILSLVVAMALFSVTISQAWDILNCNFTLERVRSSMDNHDNVYFTYWYLGGSVTEKAGEAKLFRPHGKPIILTKQNPEDNFIGGYWMGSEQEFKARYPDGAYSYQIKSEAKVDFKISHSFPPYPIIIYPDDNEVINTLTPVIQWQYVDNGLHSITILNTTNDPWAGYPVYGTQWLEGDVTSFHVPEGILATANTYRVEIQARTSNHLGASTYAVNFSTP